MALAEIFSVGRNICFVRENKKFTTRNGLLIKKGRGIRYEDEEIMGIDIIIDNDWFNSSTGRSNGGRNRIEIRRGAF